jgi:hypothetical protein
MRTTAIVVTLLLSVALINWVRQGHAFHVAQVLPFCSGRPPGFYDLAGVGMLVILIGGLRRLFNPEDDSDEG